MSICTEADGRSWGSCPRGIEGCVCGFDSPHRVANVLEQYNLWRRGGEGPQIHPAVIGQAIDAAIAIVRAASSMSPDLAAGGREGV